MAISSNSWPELPTDVTENDLRPTATGLLLLLKKTVYLLFHDRAAIIMASAFVFIMVWGHHGKLPLLRFWDTWRHGGPGSDPLTRPEIVAAIPWDHEWLSYFAGAVLLVLLPILIITLALKQRLGDFGLCLPERGRAALAWGSAGALFLLSVPFFYLGVRNQGMCEVYPMYRGGFSSVGQFLVYQLGYFAFFLTIEFTFRGYLLFGLYGVKDRPGVSGIGGPLLFGCYAIFIAMLSYTAWHLGKPQAELWGTLVWGFAAGTIVLTSGSIVPITIAHWLLNIFLDAGLLQHWASWPVCSP